MVVTFRLQAAGVRLCWGRRMLIDSCRPRAAGCAYSLMVLIYVESKKPREIRLGHNVLIERSVNGDFPATVFPQMLGF